jgi:hypothetical protein
MMNASKNKTRKAKKLVGSGKIMNIPELKESFAIIDKKTHELLKEGKPMTETIKEFKELWKSVFHRSVSSEAAQAFLEVKRTAKRKNNNNSTRKQKGGSYSLAGAPLDFTTRPGVDGTYGSFPSYMTSGLDNYNKINQEGMFQECGTKDFTAVVSRGIGSNDVV